MGEGSRWVNGTLASALLLLSIAGCEDVAVWDDGRHWDDPEIAGEPVPAYKFLDLAVSGDGTAMAVWTRGEALTTNEDVHASRYAPDSGWQAAEPLELREGAALFPSVAMDDEGRALVVWHQKDGARLDIWSNYFVPETGWFGPELLEDDDADSARRPQVAMNAKGTALAVWYQSDGTQEHIWANRFTPGSGWGRANRISEPIEPGDARRPHVAIDAGGSATAVWQQCYANCQSDDLNELRWDVWTNRFESDAGWVRARRLTPGNMGSAVRPEIATNASGSAVAVWQASDAETGRFDVWSAHYGATQGWTAAKPIAVEEAGDATRPQVAMSPDGIATVVWQFDGARGEIRASRSSTADEWTEPEAIGPDDTVQATRPRIAADRKGSAVVVWIQTDRAQPSVWSNRFAGDLGWGAPEPIETEHGDRVWEPQIGMHPEGEGLSIWSQRLRTNDQLWSRRLAWDQPPDEPDG